jgi:hypothetical protein
MVSCEPWPKGRFATMNRNALPGCDASRRAGFLGPLSCPSPRHSSARRPRLCATKGRSGAPILAPQENRRFLVGSGRGSSQSVRYGCKGWDPLVLDRQPRRVRPDHRVSCSAGTAQQRGLATGQHTFGTPLPDRNPGSQPAPDALRRRRLAKCGNCRIVIVREEKRWSRVRYAREQSTWMKTM